MIFIIKRVKVAIKRPCKSRYTSDIWLDISLVTSLFLIHLFIISVFQLCIHKGTKSLLEKSPCIMQWFPYTWSRYSSCNYKIMRNNCGAVMLHYCITERDRKLFLEGIATSGWLETFTSTFTEKLIPVCMDYRLEF